jgi:hypothetical protein
LQYRLPLNLDSKSSHNGTRSTALNTRPSRDLWESKPTLPAYVRDADPFWDHAGAGLLSSQNTFSPGFLATWTT